MLKLFFETYQYAVDMEVARTRAVHAAGVRDWVNGYAAHASRDVTRSLVAMRYQGLPREGSGSSPERSGDTRELRNTVADSYLEAYLAASDVSQEQLERLARGESGLRSGEV